MSTSHDVPAHLRAQPAKGDSIDGILAEAEAKYHALHAVKERRRELATYRAHSAERLRTMIAAVESAEELARQVGAL